MVQNPATLPISLQWWRSFSQWVGGIGVIVLMLSVIQSTSGVYRLYYSEARDDKLFPSVRSTVRMIGWIYLFYTISGIVLFRLAGMPWWVAVNHGMTAIATGGFAITDERIGAYDSGTQLAVIPMMLLGAISFRMHYRLLTQRRLTFLWHDTQHRVLLLFVAIGSTLLLLEQTWFSGTFNLIDVLFQWISALTTCGFSTVDIQPWSPSAKLLLMLAMLVGGTAGSTVGGLKMSRIVLLGKGIQWRFQQINLRPHQLMRYRLDSKVLSAGEAFARVESTAILVILWLITLFGMIVTLLHIVPRDVTTEAVLFETISAFSNVGLSAGVTHPTLHWAGKGVLMYCMWMGRLEIVPVVFLLTRVLNRHP